MAVAGILATALNTGAAHPWGLYLDGLDLMPSTKSFGVNFNSVTVVEAGPGQVSTMSFTITDSQAQVTLSPSQRVFFYDFTRNLPVFLGFVESYRIRRLGMGRTITVTAIGIETVLDWQYVPAMTMAAGTRWVDGIQALAALAYGIGVPLNTAANAGFTLSQQTWPVGPGTMGAGTSNACTINGGTLRQALETWNTFYLADVFGLNLQGDIPAVTVDFYGGLRVYRYSPLNLNMGCLDNGGITLLQSGGANPFPSDTDYGVNASGTPRNVYVIGTGAGTGLVGDGSGIPGPTIVITDPNSTTADRMISTASAQLAASPFAQSGTVGWETAGTTAVYGNEMRAGSFMFLHDDQVGITSTMQVFVQQIVKTFANSGEQTWAISFGGNIPLGSQYLRTLTRATLS